MKLSEVENRGEDVSGFSKNSKVENKNEKLYGFYEKFRTGI